LLSGRRQWLHQRDAVIARRWEQRIASQFDQLIVVSEDDADTLGGSNTQVLIIPNGVDVGQYRPAPLPAAPRIVFTGALYTLPNRDGIRWFCEEVLPLIQVAHPEVELDIVGSRPNPIVTALGSIPGVSVHADVPQISSYLDAARVVIVPIRVGSGTRLKALEGMAAGRPIVGTTIGLGGLDLVDGRHALFADDAPAFAKAVGAVLSDDRLASSLAAEGRSLVERTYAWPSIGERFVDALGRS
jgi:glycosyltransferase involved in cell wall biosynthesis